MAFQTTSPMGFEAVTEVSTTQLHPFGTTCKAYDVTYGEGEFVYVKGVASGAVGAVCTYNPKTGVTALATTASEGLIGVMMSVLDAATDFGWLQIKGSGQALTAGDVADQQVCYSTSTAGAIDDAHVAGDQIVGMVTEAARTGAGLVAVALAYPAMINHDNS